MAATGLDGALHSLIRNYFVIVLYIELVTIGDFLVASDKKKENLPTSLILYYCEYSFLNILLKMVKQ